MMLRRERLCWQMLMTLSPNLTIQAYLALNGALITLVSMQLFTRRPHCT